MTTYAWACRFWSKVDRSGGRDACWEWRACKNKSGYGRFGVASKVVLAHRAAYELMHAQSPGSLFVCHRCDNPACVNPTHLFIGTQADNVRDMRAKGRWKPLPPRDNKGERHGMSKLSAGDVSAIRASSASCYAEARRLGISPSAVSAIRRGERWSHV